VSTELRPLGQGCRWEAWELPLHLRRESCFPKGRLLVPAKILSSAYVMAVGRARRPAADYMRRPKAQGTQTGVLAALAAWVGLTAGKSAELTLPTWAKVRPSSNSTSVMPRG